MNIQSNLVPLKEGETFYLIGYRNDNYYPKEWSLQFTKTFKTVEQKLADKRSGCAHLHPITRYWEFRLEDKNVEQEIKNLTEKLQERNPSVDETYSPYTTNAVKIASLALESFSGSLLHKALAIAEAITEFENELLSKDHTPEK